MPIFLHQPVSGPLAELRFFNGRLLTGTDLDREQTWTVGRDARLGAAVGPGVVDGLLVTRTSASPPVVTIGRGTAIDRQGRALILPTDHTLQLSFDAAAPAPATDGSFARCAASSGAPITQITGPGLYLLVLRGGALPEGTAPLARIDRASDPCVKERDTEVVSFELIQLAALQQATDGDANLRRNLAAYHCFGAPELGLAASTPASFGARDAAASLLTGCDVPLALVYADATGIGWVDAWSVRRRPTPAGTQVTAARATGPRLAADAEARLAQFIDHAATLSAAQAQAALRWLPPAAPTPSTWTDAEIDALLGASEPAEATRADLALMPGLLAASLAQGAINRAATPPAAVDVWITPDNQRVFARATDGRIRLTPTGVPSADLSAVTITATRAGSNHARAFVRKGAAFVSPNLEPGAYTLAISSTRVRFAGAPPAPVVVGGQVTVAPVALELLEGSITVHVRSPLTNAAITGATVTATGPGGATRAATWNGSAYALTATAVGNWNVTATKTGFAADTETVAVSAGAAAQVTLWLTKTTSPPRKYQDFSLNGAPGRVTMLEPGVRTDERFGPTKAVFHPTQEKSVPWSPYRSASKRDVEAREVSFQSKAETWAAGKASGSFAQNLVAWDAPADVDAWLADWRDWLAETAADAALAKEIAKAVPQIFVQRGTTVAGLLDADAPAGRPTAPEGWASFGGTWLPVAFSRTSKVVPNPGYRPSDLQEIVDAYERRPGFFDEIPVEAMPWIPEEILEIALEVPPDRLGPVKDDIQRKVDRTVGALEYVPGLTTQQRLDLGALYASQSTPQAWMTPALLVQLPSSQLPIVAGLDWQTTIGSAQQITDGALWRLDASAITASTELAAGGFTTIAEVNEALTTTEGVATLTGILGEAGVLALAPELEATFVSAAVASAATGAIAGTDAVSIDLSAGSTAIAGALAGAGITAGAVSRTTEKLVGTSSTFRGLVDNSIAGRMGSGAVAVTTLRSGPR